MTAQQFQIGKTYETSSIGDSNCKIRRTVVARTNSTVTMQDESGKVQKFRISVYANVEQVKPWGSYSMAPILGADDEIEAREARRQQRATVPANRTTAAAVYAATTGGKALPPAVVKPVPATSARLALPVPVWASLAVANVLIVAAANPIPGVEIEGE